MMSGYYAVKSGRVPGIYYSWDACLMQVNKFRGAVFKKFKDLSEAEQFLNTVSANDLPRSSSNDSAAKGVSSSTTHDELAPAFKKLKGNHSPTHTSTTTTRTSTEIQSGHSEKSPSHSGVTEYKNAHLKLPMDEDSLVIYVDGGCHGNNQVHLNRCPAGWGVVILFVKKGDAEENGHVLGKLFGPVVLEEDSPYYLGATVGSNNTAELSAIGEALLWLQDFHHTSMEGRTIPVHIRFDSMYAAYSVLGIYNGAKNKELIENIRHIYNHVKSVKIGYSSGSGSGSGSSTPAAGDNTIPSSLYSVLSFSDSYAWNPSHSSSTSGPVSTAAYNISFSHVKGHSENPWNDLADTLATYGIQGVSCKLGRYSPDYIPSATTTLLPSLKKKKKITGSVKKVDDIDMMEVQQFHDTGGYMGQTYTITTHSSNSIYHNVDMDYSTDDVIIVEDIPIDNTSFSVPTVEKKQVRLHQFKSKLLTDIDRIYTIPQLQNYLTDTIHLLNTKSASSTSENTLNSSSIIPTITTTTSCTPEPIVKSPTTTTTTTTTSMNINTQSLHSSVPSAVISSNKSVTSPKKTNVVTKLKTKKSSNTNTPMKIITENHNDKHHQQQQQHRSSGSSSTTSPKASKKSSRSVKSEAK